jgi:hypothetical protein
METRVQDLVLSLCLVSIVGGCAAEQRPATTPDAAAAATSTTKDGAFQRSNLVQATATVEAIDYQTRMVTLRGQEGKSITFKAGEEVRNLAQVKKGDQVVASYYESVAVRVLKPGEAEPAVGAAGAVERAKPGEQPGISSAQTVTVVATIEQIDKPNQTVTLKSPEGKSAVVKVKDPSRLDMVKVGDKVEITYTEAVAIAVEKPTRY